LELGNNKRFGSNVSLERNESDTQSLRSLTCRVSLSHDTYLYHIEVAESNRLVLK